MRNFILFFFFFLPIVAFSQISIKVLDNDGKAIVAAKVTYNNQSYQTDNNGFVKIPIASSEQLLRVEKENFKSFSKTIKPSPK